MKNALVVLFALLFGTAGMAFGQQETPAPPKTGRQAQKDVIVRKSGAAARLNLTDDQKEKIRKLNVDVEKKLIPVESKIRLARIDLRELMAVDKPDRTAIEKKMKEVSDLEYQIKIINLDRTLGMRGILTPEQLKVWKDRPLGEHGGLMQRLRGWLDRLGGRTEELEIIRETVPSAER